jgi:transposase-like protein
MIEIITDRECRRRWSVAEKLRIVAESQELVRAFATWRRGMT